MIGEVSVPVEAAIGSDFWELVTGGLTALERGDAWAASRRLAELSHGVGLDLPAGTSGDVAAAASQEAAVAETLGRYTALIVSYQRDVSPDSAPQAAVCAALLDRLTEKPWRAPESVITLTRLSVALPAFNEEAVIAETVASCLAALPDICPNFEVIVVDDGSHDRTGAIGDALARADASVRCVHNHPNRGYGGALRAGFDAAEGAWLFFMDSDGQFDIHDIARFLRVERETPGIIALGYRAHRSDRFMRKVNAWGWKLAVRALIGLRGVRDVDCAFKLVPTSAIRACDLRSTGAAVSAEFLVKFQRMGAPVVQFPVTHLPRTKGSPTGAKPQVILRAFQELLALRASLRDWRPPEVTMR